MRARVETAQRLRTVAMADGGRQPCPHGHCLHGRCLETAEALLGAELIIDEAGNQQRADVLNQKCGHFIAGQIALGALKKHADGEQSGDGRSVGSLRHGQNITRNLGYPPAART